MKLLGMAIVIDLSKMFGGVKPYNVVDVVRKGTSRR